MEGLTWNAREPGDPKFDIKILCWLSDKKKEDKRITS